MLKVEIAMAEYYRPWGITGARVLSHAKCVVGVSNREGSVTAKLPTRITESSLCQSPGPHSILHGMPLPAQYQVASHSTSQSTRKSYSPVLLAKLA